MGCKLSLEEDKRDAHISKTIKEDKKKFDQEIKLLLLGTGESGKSTFAKQLKVLHTSGFSKEELNSYTPVITNNILSAFKNILLATEKFGKSSELYQTAPAKSIQYFLAADPLKDDLQPQVAEHVKALWSNPVIQETVLKSYLFQLPDSAAYLAENIDRIVMRDYTPTFEDILRCRARTTGIVEIEFEIDKFKFKVVDVGGQRSERKKWIHCFEGVTGLIFCVALSEYDQKLYEDERTNRMHEALELFDEMCNSEYFARTDIMLFLNKCDLFREKLKRVDLSVCFSDYNFGADFDRACNFIRTKFEGLNRRTAGGTPKRLYCHVTCATDTENVRVVFNMVRHIILNRNLEGAGII